MWLVIFTAFVWVFVFILDYGSILRKKDSLDDISEYASYSIAKGVSKADVMTGLKRLARGVTVANDYSCSSSTSIQDYQVTFNTSSINTFKGNILHKDGIAINSSKTKFNPMNRFNTVCTLRVTLK